MGGSQRIFVAQVTSTLMAYLRVSGRLRPGADALCGDLRAYQRVDLTSTQSARLRAREAPSRAVCAMLGRKLLEPGRLLNLRGGVDAKTWQCALAGPRWGNTPGGTLHQPMPPDRRSCVQATFSPKKLRPGHVVAERYAVS